MTRLTGRGNGKIGEKHLLCIKHQGGTVVVLGKAVRFLDLDRKGHTLYQTCVFHLLAGEDLHPSQLPILWVIAQMGRISQGQVARALGVSRAAVAVSAKRMERAGLVRREKESGDQRRTLVVLTPRGEAAARRARACQEELLAHRLEGFTPEETACLMGFYERMNNNLERYRQQLEQQQAARLAGEEVVC